MDSKILICLQFWDQDMPQAKALLEFLADIETRKNPFADFLLVKRFDSRPIPDQTVMKLFRKFHVHTYTSPSRETGWPQGCNGMWFAAVSWYYFMAEAKKIPHYKAMATLEADGGPIQVDWVERLSKEWDRVNKEKPVCIAGPLVTLPGEHINGNCMVTGELSSLKWITRELNGGLTGGWDYVLAPQFKRRGWANIPGMRSYYARPYFTQDEYSRMILDDLTWVHGDKSGCLCDWGRNPIIGVNAPEEERKIHARHFISEEYGL